jgi:hypothetical protein
MRTANQSVAMKPRGRMDPMFVHYEEDLVGLSRKRKKELTRLRGTASEVWNDQKDVLEHASQVVREASKQLGHLNREEVAPRVRDAVEQHLRPGVASGVATGLAVTRSAAGTTRDKLVEDVLPAVVSALASALAVIDAAKSPQVREAINRAGKVGSRLGSTVAATAPRSKSPGPGRYILIGVGLVAAAGIAYAAWQTLRADDELWVSDESDDGEPETVVTATS